MGSGRSSRKEYQVWSFLSGKLCGYGLHVNEKTIISQDLFLGLCSDQLSIHMVVHKDSIGCIPPMSSVRLVKYLL